MASDWDPGGIGKDKQEEIDVLWCPTILIGLPTFDPDQIPTDPPQIPVRFPNTYR